MLCLVSLVVNVVVNLMVFKLECMVKVIKLNNVLFFSFVCCVFLVFNINVNFFGLWKVVIGFKDK